MRALLLAICLLAPLPAKAAQILVDYQDSAGAGFFDPTPLAPPPGSTATTLGEARRLAFEAAASIWGPRLRSLVPIHVSATMTALPCSNNAGTLGQAGPGGAHIDFPGAPRAGTWYPSALANALSSDANGAAIDLDPGRPEISAVFSTAVDLDTCLGATRWYYGLTGAAPAGTIDFVTIVMHELAHGLGLVAGFDPASGMELNNRDDDFEVMLERHGTAPSLLSTMTDAQRIAASISDPNLHWIGSSANATASTLTAGVNQGHLRMHAPSPLQVGSSVSHVSTAVAPNDMFEPFYTGTNHDPRLALALLRDLGWRDETTQRVPALGGHWLLAACLMAMLLARHGPRRSGP